MTALSALWLPILVSAVAVFIVSSLMHMLLRWHWDEYPSVPDEDGVIEALRPMNIPPGDYMVPRAADIKANADPEFVDKLNKGPVMLMTVLPNGPINMGRNLALWFGYSLVISFFSAYIAGAALGSGSEYLPVFRYVGAMAFAGYGLGLWQSWIWYNRSLKTTLKHTVDSLVYAVVTAGVFGWLWP